MFYISYEMAAHRLTNLITRHFGVRVHFQRSDPDGVLWKAYENDGVLLPSDIDGTIEGQRLCRWWSSRQTFESEDSYALHYQYTETKMAWPSARDHSHFVSGLPSDTVVFCPQLGVDLTDVYSFLDRHSGAVGAH